MEAYLGTVLMRTLHILFGILWIGLLYYFNFVQTEYFKESEADAKSDVVKKLVPNALWYFRWAAAFTFFTGVYLLYWKGIATNVGITLGAIMATIMAANVWFVIWPNQKKVIAGAPDAAEAGAKAGQFAPKGFRGKGSSSIANDPKYAGKTCPDGRKARRGKARLVGGQERFKKNAPSCGRDDPSRKNKCSLPEETVKVPKAEDGLIPVEKFALALDRKQREIEKLKRSISVLKKKKQTKVV